MVLLVVSIDVGYNGDCIMKFGFFFGFMVGVLVVEIVEVVIVVEEWGFYVFWVLEYVVGFFEYEFKYFYVDSGCIFGGWFCGIMDFMMVFVWLVGIIKIICFGSGIVIIV